jgi:group I intron endonuclease
MPIYTLYQYQHRESGKKYIGVTNDLTRRHRQHVGGYSNALAFNRAIKKYGITAFDFQVLAIFDRVEAAEYHEQAAILKFRTLAPDGYNLKAGAPCTRYSGSPSAATRKKISKGNTGHKPFLGRHHSIEARRKISESHKGCHPSAETLVKLSLVHTGQHLSEEARRKVSAALRGRPVSIETRAKMSASAKRRMTNKRRIA